MSAAEKLTPDQLPLTTEECAELWSMSKEWWLRTIACKPGFPRPIAKGVWIAGEVLEYRRDHRI